MDTILRVHWLGKKKIAADTNSAGLMTIWKMPESVKFEAETLDKLSLAPWRWLRGETNETATNLLRPLLQDLTEQESYVEVRRPVSSTNAAEEMILAVRLDDARAGLWQTNVSRALESLTGIKPVSAGRGWSLKKHHAPKQIELARAGEWTVLGAAEDHNALLDETLARIEREHAPFAAPATNAWLEADIDLRMLADLRRKTNQLAAELPKVSLRVVGDGTNVYTTGELVFPRAEFASLDEWIIPTNLIQANFTGFTAIRGIAPLLKSCEAWDKLNAGPPPDQLYVWALTDVAMETYFAAPSAEASNTVARITDLVLQKSEKWHLTNQVVSFRRARTNDGLEWGGLPYVMPFLQSITAAGTNFIFGGSFQPQMMYPASSNVFSEIYDATNLIYYDWERTGDRIGQLIYLTQFARFAADRTQLPKSSSALLWLKALEPKLRVSTTRFEKTTIPEHVKFYRKSSIGLTALELHLLVHWLELNGAEGDVRGK